MKYIKKKLLINSVMLYGLTGAKMLFPLITLPYLTRVLSMNGYGAVSYVKSVMQYMQLLIDFGFMLSGVKDVVRAREDINELKKEVWNIFGARMLLALLGLIATWGMTCFVPILKQYRLYALLSYIPIILSIFLFDYFFRGIEQMQIITIRFVIMKSISTTLTFFMVRSDKDIMWIAILDIIGSLAAIILVLKELHNFGIRFVIPSLRESVNKLAVSAVYFVSNVATTAFGALNTFLIGIVLPASDIAKWSVCLQMIAAIQSMYTPITDGIYPEMVKSKSFGLLKKVFLIFMPIIVIGGIFSCVVAESVLLIIGGEKYAESATLFRCMIPILVFSFPSSLFGWPALGAIGKAKEVSKTTICAALMQVFGLGVLLITNSFTLLHIAILRVLSEALMMALRVGYCFRFKKEFEK